MGCRCVGGSSEAQAPTRAPVISGVASSVSSMARRVDSCRWGRMRPEGFLRLAESYRCLPCAVWRHCSACHWFPHVLLYQADEDAVEALRLMQYLKVSCRFPNK